LAPTGVLASIVGSTTGGVGGVIGGGVNGGDVVGGGVNVGGGTGIPVPTVRTVSVAEIEDMGYPSAGSLVTTSKSYDVCDCKPVMVILVALVEPP
jgi:hypothetical protein